MNLCVYRLREVLFKNQFNSNTFLIAQQYAKLLVGGWGGLYDTHLKLSLRLQDRILKIILIIEDDEDKPLCIKQVFVLNVIVHQYYKL